MQINTTLLGLTAELRVQGRVDTFWADHLRDAVGYVLDQGARNVRLHLGAVDYLSSAGIRALITSVKTVQAKGGRLEVTQPSASAMAILDMAGLAGMVSSQSEDTQPAQSEVQEWATDHAIFQVHDLGTASSLQCAFVGSPAGMRSGLIRGNDTRNLMFPDSTFGLGLGAFGTGYEECRGRHGEFLAVSGAAAYQPTDGTEVPEYMVSEGDWVPEFNVLYGLWCQGAFQRLLRFDARPDPGMVPLLEIAQRALDTLESPTIGIVMLAESTGLLGVGLKRSITSIKSLEAPLSYRDVRKSLSGEPRRVSDRVLSLVAGVVTSLPPSELSELFHPIADGAGVFAHLNAAVFPRHSVDEDIMDLRKTVQALFQSETLRDIVHLIPDEAHAGLGGQSHFLRGSCWAGAIDSIVTDAG